MSGSLRRGSNWVHPVTSQNVIPRPMYVLEKKSTAPRYAAFNEIFPAKYDSPLRKKKAELSLKAADTFHRAIGPILIVGQCFGLLPVSGVLKQNALHLKFTWWRWPVAYSVVTMTAFGTLSTMSALQLIIFDADIYKTSSLMFFGSCCVSMALFLQLASHWPSLGRAMAEDEHKRPRMDIRLRKHIRGNPAKKETSLRAKFYLACCLTLSVALMEHCLSIISGVAVAQECGRGTNINESYFLQSFSQLFSFTEYALWKAIIAQIVNILATFTWNFMDLFIMMISLGLSDRFKELNERLEMIAGKNLPEQFWKAARIEYFKLTELVRLIDNAVNKIVLLSFANNLYFICLQLFNALDNGHPTKLTCGKSKNGDLWSLTHVIYFTFSFSFLLSRSLAVSLLTAALHSESKRPATVLYAVPAETYCTEVHRFLYQVVTDKVGLTGLNFFHVTRGLILSIAGTIVTYELVLVQFNTPPIPVTANITINSDNRTGVSIKT